MYENTFFIKTIAYPSFCVVFALFLNLRW